MQNEECNKQNENPNVISWDGESVISKEFALATVREMIGFIRRAYYHPPKLEDTFYIPLIDGEIHFKVLTDNLNGLERYIEAEEERQAEAIKAAEVIEAERLKELIKETVSRKKKRMGFHRILKEIRVCQIRYKAKYILKKISDFIYQLSLILLGLAAIAGMAAFVAVVAINILKLRGVL